jgi:H+/Cl- antiporter ClcA
MSSTTPSDGRRRWQREAIEQAALAGHLARWIVLGVASGALAGVSSFVFLEGLDRVTRFRGSHGWLLWLLPAAGLIIGSAYHYLGGRAAQGNALLIDQIHEPTEWVPRRMAPLVLLGTWATHLFGGSVGREGTALQMSGSLTDQMSRALCLDDDDRRLLLIAALAGGFGAVFGVPLAGAVFALEVQSVGRVRYEALVPSLTASLVGHLVVSGLGYHHPVRPQFDVSLDGWLVAKVVVAGLVFGLVGAVFAELTHAIKRLMDSKVGWPPLRLVIGGVAVIGLAGLFGRDYLGLSLPLAERALGGDPLSFAVFALKILFTVITLGCAFPGGGDHPVVRDRCHPRCGAGFAAAPSHRVACRDRVRRSFCGRGQHTAGVHHHGRRTVRLRRGGATCRRLRHLVRVLQPSWDLPDAADPRGQGSHADRGSSDASRMGQPRPDGRRLKPAQPGAGANASSGR